MAPLWCGLLWCSMLSGAYDGVGERGDVALEGAEDMWVRFPGNFLLTAMIIEKDAI